MTQTSIPTRTPQRVLGEPIDRVDGHVKTTGAAQYSGDHLYPDLAHAALVHATVPRARITHIDTTAADSLPGVHAVITHHNAPRLQPPPKPTLLNLPTLAAGTSVNYLNTDEVHWNGQPVAVVVADSLDIAREAAQRIRVTYEELPATVDFEQEEPNAVPQKNSALSDGGGKKGDAVAALKSADVSVDLRFSTPMQHHNAIEPHTTTAVWNGKALTVHDGTQHIDWTRRHLALRFKLPLNDVRVISTFVGGAFGGKTNVWAGTILAVVAAKVTGRPVKLALSREGVYRTTGGRTPSTQRVALGADADGQLTALIHTSVTQMGRVGGYAEQVVSQSRHLYDAENILVQQHQLTLDSIANGVMRAPGESIGSFALEAAMDELAHRLDLDPIELRMRNEPDRNPMDGKLFARRGLREAYARGAERFRWADRTPEPRSMRDGRWLVGTGVATAFHPAWVFPANVTMRLSADGDVLVRCGFHEMGMGAATAFTQVTAHALRVPLDSVRIEYGDSDLPIGPGAGGSAQTASVSRAILDAAAKLKKDLAALARRNNTSPDEAPATILSRAGRTHHEVAVGADRGIGRLAGQVRFMSTLLRERRKYVKAACGAQFCEVRVDSDTGEVRVTRWLGVFDIGTVVNAKTAASQLRGGIVMGIGAALGEETLVDGHTGRIVNANLAEYHVPVHADVPRIDIECLGDPDPTMPLGVLGAGEVGIVGVAGAIANAVHHATGLRVRDLPITLDKLL
ncbi:xanthine dehydrogenase family protein molybdopterin-binding subunit [Actinophytocola algeriensis]|uniref:Xanthine dehydrogenase YagR molybdenum-binding subunit n=1 Tax=Actinophytocola algeriensis TaxID=1768010 RepID=A0A7W7Q6R6_9PSEU|nr:xanthine dehydrogenase family protein molybdopterin-binding subunit [Actinophytocola algeriensis]MBB4907893.1 xanthine dehydrogenase YagR molybdenum-binding subunit [Actinophytocola algeriensis]MBE1479923.1 xanthine dehydrogenase YagR molybdenum-binding subunit [Actinophytocola algeriensis]